MVVPAMLQPYISEELRMSQEFQSALVRLAVWVFMISFLGVAGIQGYYQVNWHLYVLFFGAHLVWFSGILVSTIRHPEHRPVRRYISMLADLSGTTFCIYLGGEPLSPFYLLYIWTFVSQGTRYGKTALKAASIGSVLSYSVVLTLLEGWQHHGMEAVFLILLLVVLPIYEHILLRRLHEARQAAEAANQARGNFLATMTHELRTPLSGVIGMSRLLSSTKLDSEQREYVDSLSSSANMLQSLIGDILDLSKIDARKLELKPEAFDIRHSVAEVAHALANQALDQGVEMLIDVAPEVPTNVYGDPLRFRQILFNLVGNAVKFTETGHVQIAVGVGESRPELRQQHLRLAVSDTGIGIPRNKLGQIFDSFWQVDTTTTRRYGGTGLGTAIARDLTRLMKGEIGVESVEGQGSTFWVCLPFLGNRELDSSPPRPVSSLQGRTVLLFETYPERLALMEKACDQAGMRHVSVDQVDKLTRAIAEHTGPLDVVVLADNIRGLDLEGLSTLVDKLRGDAVPTVFVHYSRRKVAAHAANTVDLVKPCTPPALWDAMAVVMAATTLSTPNADAQSASLLNTVPEGQGAKVLVAEDDGINARLISSLLSKAGHQVVLVRDGMSALEAARKQGFDLALVDLRMPKMDGMDFTRAYRQHETEMSAGQRLPIVALTANAAEDARAECMEAGMDDFLTKPVDPQLLDRLLSRYRHHAAS
jgi:two-component system sensor histidine kinase RpfC